MIKIFTIGVYNSDEQSYFDKLINSDIDLFLDIRQRRGIRGSQYKYVNSNYLQARLKELGIEYLYIKEQKTQNNNLNCHHKNLEKEQHKPQISEKKAVI